MGSRDASSRVKEYRIKKMVAKVSKAVKKVGQVTFVVDCQLPVADNILDPAGLEKYFTERIKVANKAGNLGDKIKIVREDSKITVTADLPFSKRYLKYLTKKYLKKQQLRDFLRVISADKKSYEIRYFNITGDDNEE